MAATRAKMASGTFILSQPTQHNITGLKYVLRTAALLVCIYHSPSAHIQLHLPENNDVVDCWSSLDVVAGLLEGTSGLPHTPTCLYLTPATPATSQVGRCLFIKHQAIKGAILVTVMISLCMLRFTFLFYASQPWLSFGVYVVYIICVHVYCSCSWICVV